MQTVSSDFTRRASSNMRKLAWKVYMSFQKEYDADIDFFTIGVSLIGGPDFIPGAGSVVQEWDKYQYVDYSHKVISIEWTKQVELFASVTMGMADIVFDNSDNYFTPNSNSPISDYILPYRPIRIMAGFGDEVIPVFIGITEKMPIIDEKAKTASFHCIDFMYSLLNKPISDSQIYINQTTDEILESLFSLAGISADQLSLDPGFTEIPFAYFERGYKLGEGVRKLMQAEAGRIYMDENGVIQFKNRQNYSSTPVYTFDAYNNIEDIRTREQDDIINVVEIRGSVRAVQPKQRYWQLQTPIEISAGESFDLWASLQDPVTTIDPPMYIDNAVTSSFSVNTAYDGSGLPDATNLVLSSSSLFAQAYKMTFQNNGSVSLYITQLDLYATPVIVISEIDAREQDDDSVSKYDEQVLTINNDFFQSQSSAEGKAVLILNDFATFGGVQELTVKGTPALQLDDTVTINIFDRIDNYKISKIRNRISQPAKFTQILNVRKFTPRSYFTIGVSLIGGTDQLQP